MFPFVAVSAVVPSFLLIWYFHARDLNKEPIRVLWATFGLGVATVIPVLIVALPLMKLTGQIGQPALRGLCEAVFTAAIPEEFFKLFVVVVYCSRHKEFDEPMDGVVYGAVASLGFATLENIMYVAGGGLGVAAFRAISAVPGHGFMGAIMGYYVAQARFGPVTERTRNLVRAYFIPVLLHAAYDAPLLANKATHESGHAAGLVGITVLVSVGVLIFEWRWTVRIVRRLRAQQIAVVRTTAIAVVTPEVIATEVVQTIETRQAYPPPPIKHRSAWSIVWLVIGALLASVGGLVTLAVLIGTIASSQHGKSQNVAAVIVGTLLFGVLPLAGGLLLFRLGLRRWST